MHSTTEFNCKNTPMSSNSYHRITHILPATLLIAALFVFGTSSSFANNITKENDPVLSNSDFFLAENGVTVMCPDAEVGDSGTVNGVKYTKRTRDEININNAATTCTSSVSNFTNLFFNQSSFNEDISTWDTSSVDTMNSMFEGAGSFNQPIGHWDVSNVWGMASMFRDATAFNQDISNWDTGELIMMDRMFSNASSFNQPIGNWDVSKVDDIRFLFANASSFNQPIGDWELELITNYFFMFANAVSFNQDISGWDMSNAISIANMFQGAESFNQDIGNWDVSNISEMGRTFEDAAAFNQDLTGWCVINIAQEPIGFADGSALIPEHYPLWGTCGDTSVGDDSEIANTFTLKQNYPNPFNPTTQIQYELPEAAEVLLEVYTLNGQLVVTLVNGTQNAGSHSIAFDATGLSSGMYIYRLSAGNFVETKKMILVK